MSLIRLGVLAAGLSIWYPLHQMPDNYEKSTNRYSLPKEIEVVNASYERKSKESFLENESNSLPKKVKTEDIDFSKDLTIETERYKLIKDEDWLPSRLIGHTSAMIGRLLFWDWNYGWGQDEERTKAVLSMLEKDTTIKDITVRLNHNEAFYDLYRLFSEKKLKERNNPLARILMGIPHALMDEAWSELSRGSYYNPLTRTAVCYSNIESITAHEIGHHQDFSRYTSDWEYGLARLLPPVALYQEWNASTSARDQILEKQDDWQFNRFLIPAFATYILAYIGAGLRYVSKKSREDQH